MRRVVGPILAGGDAAYQLRDLEYLRDLGLIDDGQPPRIANPIYQEVVPRELGYILQSSLDENMAWYVDAAGRLDMGKLLEAFATFYAEHAGHWLGQFEDYREAAPQLILQAYLQRIVNGGGRIEREYGLGRGRTDLLVLWPREPGQPSDLWERFVIECKVLRDTDRQSLEGHHRARRRADPRLHGAVPGGGRASGADRPPRTRRGTGASRRRATGARRPQAVPLEALAIQAAPSPAAGAVIGPCAASTPRGRFDRTTTIGFRRSRGWTRRSCSSSSTTSATSCCTRRGRRARPRPSSPCATS